MADAPWQCQQCGTINEPVANSCRSCGRWPSLFDLERGAVTTGATVEDETWSHRPVEVDELHPEVSVEPQFDLEPIDAEPVTTETVFDADEDAEQRTGRGKLIRSLIVPIAFAVYIVISIVFGERGSS